MSRVRPSYVSEQGGGQFGWGTALSLGLHLLLVAAIVFWPGFGSSRRQIFAPVYRVNLVGAPGLPPGPAASAPAAPKAKPTAAAKKPAPVKKAAPLTPPAKKAEAIGAKKRAEELAKKKAEELARKKKELEKQKAERLKREKKKRERAESRALERKLSRLQSKVSQERRLEGRLNALEAKMEARADRAGSGAYAAGRGGGGGGNQASMRFQVYYTRLWEQVRSNWVLSEARVADAKGLMAVVVITLKNDGSLQKAQLEKGSGNRAFDESCLAAVQKAAPFPPFPAGLRDRRMEVGVRFRADDMNPG